MRSKCWPHGCWCHGTGPAVDLQEIRSVEAKDSVWEAEAMGLEAVWVGGQCRVTCEVIQAP